MMNEENTTKKHEEPNVEIQTKMNDGDTNEDHSSSTSKKKKSGGCSILHNYQITTILVFAVVGLGAGIGLSFWQPDDVETKKVTIKWIGLIGDLFLRSLKCFVLPLVFVNVIIAVVDMMSIGKASSIGWTVIGSYLLTTVTAATFGVVSTLIFMGFYKPLKETEDADSDIDNVAQVSVSDTFYDGIFKKIVPDNIVGAFAGNEFAAVIFFAVVFGSALAPLIIKGKGNEGQSLMGIFKESDIVFQRILRWIILLTPFAVCSLITQAIGQQDDLGSTFSNIGLLMAAALCGWGFQIVFIYIGLFAVVTKSNPIAYLKHIVPAQIFAFASASSAATIPASLEAVRSTGRVHDTIGRFVIPLGATINMDGGAVYFVCACIWLAVLNGEEITIASFLLLIIIATVGSIGTAPVPSASLVLIITAYNAVFGGTGQPNGFAYIFAVDWFMDRCRTATNITGDCIVAGVVAHVCSIEDIDDTEAVLKDANDDDDDENNSENDNNSQV